VEEGDLAGVVRAHRVAAEERDPAPRPEPVVPQGGVARGGRAGAPAGAGAAEGDVVHHVRAQHPPGHVRARLPAATGHKGPLRFRPAVAGAIKSCRLSRHPALLFRQVKGRAWNYRERASPSLFRPELYRMVGPPPLSGADTAIRSETRVRSETIDLGGRYVYTDPKNSNCILNLETGILEERLTWRGRRRRMLKPYPALNGSGEWFVAHDTKCKNLRLHDDQSKSLK
jgi:hypothetical protein